MKSDMKLSVFIFRIYAHEGFGGLTFDTDIKAYMSFYEIHDIFPSFDSEEVCS